MTELKREEKTRKTASFIYLFIYFVGFFYPNLGEEVCKFQCRDSFKLTD